MKLQDLVVSLANPRAESPAVVGGKAASLARLGWLRIPTPPGCCVTVDAYRLYLAENKLEEREAILRLGADDERARHELAELCQVGAWPPTLSDQLQEQVTNLGVDSLAVRSSAVGEDAAATSFAGQHDTLLDLTPDRVEAAVRQCWASLWTQRATAYRRAHDIAHRDSFMAVLIQPLLSVDVSVLAFTCDPLTGDTASIVIHAAAGLRPDLAAGTVTPDVIVVDRVSLTARHESTGSSDNGGNLPAQLHPPAGSPLVSAAQVEHLVELLVRVERGFRCPVDVEAALVKQDWVLLQARPVSLRQIRSARASLQQSGVTR